MTVRDCTQANLAATLRSCKPGDTVRMAGTFAGSLQRISIAAPGVTIVPGPEGALTQWIQISGSSGLTFRGFDVTNHGAAAIGVWSSENITFDNCRFTGAGGDKTGGGGLSLRGSKNVTIRNCKFSNMSGGASMLNCDGVVFSGNEFHDLWADAITGNPSGNVLVENNRFTDFRGPPLHLDCIQLYNTGVAGPLSNVVIRNNRFERGTGSPAQFIFLGNNSSLGYRNVTVTGNAAFGPSWHGIMISGAKDTLVEDNFIQGWNDSQGITPWIDMRSAGENVTVRRNVSTSFLNRGSPDVVMKDNKTIRNAKPTDRKLFDAWLKDHEAKASARIADPLAQAAMFAAALEATGSRRAALALMLTGAAKLPGLG